MGTHLDHAWRILATGIGFVTFSIMGLLFRFIACPALTFLYRNTTRRKHAARHVIHVSFALFIRFMVFMNVMQVQVKGVDKLNDRPRLLCPSHPTLIDVVILMSLIKNSTCIVKAALKDSFALRAPVTAAGFVTNDSGPELVNTCAQALLDGDTLIIFPEGTRSQPNRPPRLQHGAAAISIQADTPITPVKITCTPPALMKGVPWYHVPCQKMQFTIEVLEDIDPKPFISLVETNGRPVAIRRLTQQLKDQLFS